MRLRPAALLLTLLLTGCAAGPQVVPVADPAGAWQSHKERLARLENWRLDGRLAVQSEGEGWHAGVRWEQGPGRYSIRLSGPAGQGSAEVEGRGELVELRTGGRSYTSFDAGQLFEEHFGWRLPVEALRWWALGLPAPGEPGREQLDGAGRLSRLSQSDWIVEFFDYAPRNGTVLPGKVFATHPQAKVRLVVDRWELGAEVHQAGSG